jgi:hypothetical protein
LPTRFRALTEYSENNQVVPKKSKNLKNESNEANTKSAPLKTARRRTSTSAKKTKASRKTTAPAKSSARPEKSSGIPPLTDEEIKLRAYFISERRHRLGLLGDSNSDWLEAKRQLLSEVGPC